MLGRNLKPDLVIFDCDGVLVDSEVISNQVLIDNLTRYGLTLSLAQSMDMFVGGTMAGVADKARSLGADLPDDWVDEVYRETYARLRQGVEPVAGIPSLLALLDECSVAYCVASNGSEDKMQITLGQNGLWERFEGKRFSAHTLGVAKPDPALFEIAARTMGADISNCVVIEDSPSGALAAQRANMRCYGYAAHGDGAKLAELGAEIISDMNQLQTLLKLVP